ncbi:hypothetical protein RHMOL_Rhmol01G0061900 [Rhododendron molle]|uniref:Uncharacterized protein n=1 Tax=Rhododendron molle TaxID=49168 RepID=A0ACC0PZ61_RHOML|nr:hypothetical protein RHMOL_Rhmol01G0061900 [Rhododendron molle]
MAVKQCGKWSFACLFTNYGSHMVEYGMGNEVSTSGDVYSYGILLLEMVTGKRPTDMFTGSLNLHNFATTALSEPEESIFDPTLIPQGKMGETSKSISSVLNQGCLSSHKIHECLISLLQVGITCSEEQPTDRPDINQVVTDFFYFFFLGQAENGCQ